MGGWRISKEKYRINQDIRARECRLIDEVGNQVGVVNIEVARQRAEEAGMDLVEIAPEAAPPVCKLLDYGKLKFKESKKAAKAKRASHQVVLKEVRMRPKTEEHDFQVKLRNIIRFLEEGNKVQITVMFKGREITYQDRGMRHMQRIVELLAKLDPDKPEDPKASIEQPPVQVGNKIIMVLMPFSKLKSK